MPARIRSVSDSDMKEKKRGGYEMKIVCREIDKFNGDGKRSH